MHKLAVGLKAPQGWSLKRLVSCWALHLTRGFGPACLQVASSELAWLQQSHESVPVVQMDLDKIEWCRNPDGSKQNLGKGSFGTVRGHAASKHVPSPCTGTACVPVAAKKIL